MEGIKFSVIIPTFNRSLLLKKAIASILDQSYKNIEVIVVDDGGSDDSENVVKSFQEDRVRYFWKEHGERSIAKNFGIDKATGDYINFLDSDDYQLAEHFFSAEQILKENSCDILHFGFEVRNQDNQLLVRQNNWDFNVRKKIFSENMLHGNAVFIKTSILVKHGFLQNRKAVLSEDWYLWITLAIRYSIHFSTKVTSVVVEHEGRSLNQSNPEKVKDSHDLVIERLKDDNVFMNMNERYRSIFNYQLMSYNSLIFATHSRKLEALKYLRKSIGFKFHYLFKRRSLAILKLIILK